MNGTYLLKFMLVLNEESKIFFINELVGVADQEREKNSEDDDLQ